MPPATPASRVLVHVENASAAAAVPAARSLRGWVEAALPARGRAEVCVRIVDEAEMRRLNGRYRGKRKPTNVLSFPAALPGGLKLPLLGDIVVCAPVVSREAREQGKRPRAHWAHMLVHGTLHLRGFDHEHEAEARAMERRERRILAALGFPDPYSV